jgi:cytochrome c551/c552
VNAQPTTPPLAELSPETREAIRSGLTSAACLGCDEITTDAIGDSWFKVAQFTVEEPTDMPSRVLAVFCSVECMKSSIAKL